MEINGYENYLIYEDGRVWSKKRKIFMSPSKNYKGYLRIGLCKNSKSKRFYIHRLIALHYIPNPNNKSEVDHINNIRNDNRVENLQWLTSQENLDKIFRISNTGEKYISYDKIQNRYYIEKKKCFRTTLSCKNYTLQDAINLRDELLIEYNIVEPSI
tara:strand:+ start:404 stop:874 length:471 start_codon:yes stop_codon:yes gene_type:complete